MFERLGIADAVRPKVVLMYAFAGGVENVAKGGVETGNLQHQRDRSDQRRQAGRAVAVGAAELHDVRRRAAYARRLVRGGGGISAACCRGRARGLGAGGMEVIARETVIPRTFPTVLTLCACATFRLHCAWSEAWRREASRQRTGGHHVSRGLCGGNDAALRVRAGTPGGCRRYRILSPGATEGVLNELLPQFDQASGHKRRSVYGPAGDIANRIRKGEAVDVLISSEAEVDRLRKEGKMVDGSQTVVTKAASVSSFARAIRSPTSAPPKLSFARSRTQRSSLMPIRSSAARRASWSPRSCGRSTSRARSAIAPGWCRRRSR